MNKDECDVMSALIIDQLFKTILIKLDSVFGIQDKRVEEVDKECEQKIRVMKAACQQKLDLQLQQFERRKAEFESTIQSLKDKIEGQSQIIEKL